MFIGFGEGPLYPNDMLLEDTLPSRDVQRVYDETHDVQETEILCGVREVRVNASGAVIAYKSL
jgi:hypothetical protein